METLLEPPGKIVEESAPWSNRYSAVEGEILEILRRPAMFPQSLKELLHELTPVFSDSQVWRGIHNLLDDELIRIVYTTGYEIGLEWA